MLLNCNIVEEATGVVEEAEGGAEIDDDTVDDPLSNSKAAHFVTINLASTEVSMPAAASSDDSVSKSRETRHVDCCSLFF